MTQLKLRITLLLPQSLPLSPTSRRGGLPFVLHFIELPFQLVDQFVNGGVHIFMTRTGNQMAVWRVDGCISDKTLRLLRQNDVRVD